MFQIFDLLINRPLGFILSYIYSFTGNYGVAIIIFTLFTKIILLPFSIKQQKSTLEMQRIKPFMDEIQKKYKDNKEKQQEEMVKLYSEHGVNPMAGCLPMLIQLPIIFGLYQVIIKPLSYILGYSAEQIAELTAKYADMTFGYSAQISIANLEKLVNFNFIWLDLSAVPQFDMNNIAGSISLIWIIPLLAAGSTYFSSKYMSSQMASASPEQAQTSNMMNMLMPVMTLWFSFTMPAGLGLYWTASNLLQMAQQFAMNMYFIPKLKEGALTANDKKSREKRKNN